MFNIGTQEVLVVLLLVFLLFGPRHIPEVAHALGKGLGDLRRALQGIEDNAKRAGGDLPRFPRDLDDLADLPPKRPWGSSEPVVGPRGGDAPATPVLPAAASGGEPSDPPPATGAATEGGKR